MNSSGLPYRLAGLASAGISLIVIPMTAADLKDALINSEDFTPIASCFFNLMDELARDPTRNAMGEPIDDPDLTGIVKRLVNQAFPERQGFDISLLCELKTDGLVHGQGTVGGMCFILIFFRDIDTGMVIAITDPRQSIMAYIRFRLTLLPSGVYEILSSTDPNMN